MIDTDKYEGCQTDRPLFLHKGYLCPTIFMDVDGSGEIVPTLDRRLVDVQADIPEHYLQLLQDAPLLLAEVKRLRQEIKDYDACLQNLWDNELIPDDTDIWDEVKELLEVD